MIKKIQLTPLEVSKMRTLASKLCRTRESESVKVASTADESITVGAEGERVYVPCSGYAGYSYSPGIQSVKGYVKSSGTYIAPHYRTKANSIAIDNWSAKGNRNPFTEKKAPENKPAATAL